MPQVKPYIITVKYVAFYEGTRPTVDQVANELNMDALEITIEDAVVTAKPKAASPELSASPSMPAGNTVHTVPVVDTKGLEKGGPSEKVLKTLAQSGPRTLAQIRQLANLNGPSVQVTVSRLKKQGRICVTGNDAGKSIYKFVK
jgi:hypothetical protein